ncbi:MAG: 50S ribosomal protein L6 [Clostridia bacterium]|nr:50S ribosomal protein L6 [Clostridia bacterium]
MSRIGKMPIILPSNVTLDQTTNGEVIVTGPKGTLRQWVDSVITVSKSELNGKNVVVLTRNNEAKETRAKHGLYRALIANMVKGVTEGYAKSLTVNGVGYKLAIAGNKLTMNIGLSHPVVVEVPQGLTVSLPSPLEIKVEGIDKTFVGQFAADIKAIKPIEPYHGYGIRYTDEVVHLKEIKKAGKKK